MIHNKAFPVILGVVLLACAAGCVSSPEPSDGTRAVEAGGSGRAAFEKAVADLPFEERAVLRVGSGLALYRFDSHSLNRGAGSVLEIPAGEHTVEAGETIIGGRASVSCVFQPGKSYVLDSKEYTSSTKDDVMRGYRVEITTFNYTLYINEYGVTGTAIPPRNASILEFDLEGQRGFTVLTINGTDYLLSGFQADAREKLRLFLPPGALTVYSQAIPGEKADITLPPSVV